MQAGSQALPANYPPFHANDRRIPPSRSRAFHFFMMGKNLVIGSGAWG